MKISYLEVTYRQGRILAAATYGIFTTTTSGKSLKSEPGRPRLRQTSTSTLRNHEKGS